jgi:hypothetical protein
MLTKLDVSTSQGNLLSFQLDDDTSGYLVQNIDGLDPVKATLVSSSFAGVDGEQYQSARRETRNIKLTVGLDPDPLTDTVRGLRKQLYGYLMPKSEVTLTFYDDEAPTVNIVGRVESLETALFTQEPAVDVSIICYDPDFVDPVGVHLPASGHVLQTTSGTSDAVISYDGSVDTGTVITLNVNRTLSDFTIYHQPPNDDLRQLDFSAPLVAGDVLTISSVTGDKGVTLTRAGTQSSLLYGMSPQSSWIELMPGDNLLHIYATGAGVPYTIDYVTKYGGL